MSDRRSQVAVLFLVGAMALYLGGSDAAVAQATAAQNSRFVPTSEKWAGVEAANVLPDMLTDIAQGGDIDSAAKTADAAIESQLNG